MANGEPAARETGGSSDPEQHGSSVDNVVAKESYVAETMIVEQSAENPGRGRGDASNKTGASRVDGIDRSGGGGGSPEERKDGVIFSKGKMVSKESSPNRRVNGESRRPPANKLMRDAITGRTHQAGCSGYDEASGSSSHPKSRAGESTKAAACRYEFGGHQVTGALLAVLAELGASAPRLVDRKLLTSTDVRVDQSRLQISSRSPFSGIFVTVAEKGGVRVGDGMQVMAFDRGGRAHELVCKLFRDKNYYRLRGNWRGLLEEHGLLIGPKATLDRRVTVELWAFRSRAMPRRKHFVASGHPDGELGLVVLFRDEGEGEVGEEEAAVAVQEQVAVGVQEEAPSEDADAEPGDGEAGAGAVVARVQEEAPLARGEARGYDDELVRQLMAGTVLWVLRTSNRRAKRKRGDD
ncbi:hypothetical protein ACP70R_038313 [Stipagrostis hirtigluma subsp. patula]